MADTSSSNHVFHPTWRTPVTTQELPISSYAVSRPPSQPRRNAERIFFSGMALLLCLVVFIGFFATFFGAGFVRAPLPNAVLRVHGIVFTAWMLLLVTQAVLVFFCCVVCL